MSTLIFSPTFSIELRSITILKSQALSKHFIETTELLSKSI